MVNRGRLPYEYKDSKMHLTPPNQIEEVIGVLFSSEGAGMLGAEEPVQEGKRRSTRDMSNVRFDVN